MLDENDPIIKKIKEKIIG